MILSILVGILVYTYRMRHRNGQPQRAVWRESGVSGTTRRAQYSISSATDAPALIITPFVSSNNFTDTARFGAQSGSYGWEEGMPRPPQPSTRYPAWKRPDRPLLPTFRAEVHAQAPHLPHRNPSLTAEIRYTPAPSFSDYLNNNALSPQTSSTPGPSDTLSPSPMTATSTTPLTWDRPAAPILNGGYRSPRRPELAVVATPTTARSPSLRQPVSAGLRESSQRPFSEVSIAYLVEPLSPDPRSPALVATSPIDGAYLFQHSALPTDDEKPKTPLEHGALPLQSPSLQPPGPVVEPSSLPSLGTRRPSQPTLTPPPSAGGPQSGSRPTTPNSRMRVAEARERQERARREREEAKIQEQMRSLATGIPATFRIAKGLEARDARSKATDNMQDILDALDEQRIDTVIHKGSRGKKMGFKRPKGMSIDTRMAGGSLKGKKSPTGMGVSTPKTSASSRPPPTAGIPMDIEPGSPPERGLSGMGDHEIGVLTNASITRPRKVDRKGTDEDRIPSWPLEALQLQSPGFGSGTSSPLTSPELKNYSNTGRAPPTSAQSSAPKEASRVDVPSSPPIDHFNSPLTPNTPSAGLATPSWLQSTFMSVPQTPPSAGVPSPTSGMPISEALSLRPLNVRRLPVPPERPEASTSPIVVARDSRFSTVDPRQAVATDHRRGRIDVLRTNTPLSGSPSAYKKTPTPVRTSARTAEGGASGWF